MTIAPQAGEKRREEKASTFPAITPLTSDSTLQRRIREAWEIHNMRNPNEIANLLGCSVQYVRRILLPYRRADRARIKKRIMELRQQGLSFSRISQEIHIPPSTAKRLIKSVSDDRRRDLLHILAKIGVPPKYVNCSFDTFEVSEQTSMQFHQCKDYASSPHASLFMFGAYGTGKTHLAVAITRELLVQGKEVLFTSVPRLLFEIRKAFRNNAQDLETSCVEKYLSCEFLILDDFGVEKTTEWARQTLDYIIYERDNYLKPMVITSNLSLDEVAERIDGRISSRLAGMGSVIRFQGPDYRLKGGKIRDVKDGREKILHTPLLLN